jgi:hypothetical protein
MAEKPESLPKSVEEEKRGLKKEQHHVLKGLQQRIQENLFLFEGDLQELPEGQYMALALLAVNKKVNAQVRRREIGQCSAARDQSLTRGSEPPLLLPYE